MCGRYQLKNSARLREEAEEVTGVSFEEFDLRAPRYNVAPGQLIPTLASDRAGRPRLGDRLWGFIPPWEKSAKPKIQPVNARAEEAPGKAMFRESIQDRRCLIPADGFYEWRRDGLGKQPFDIHLKGDRPFFFAGIFSPAGETWPETCLLFTTKPNELMAGIHDRMPAILTRENAREWIRPGPLALDQFAELTAPIAADTLEARPVSSYVNSARHEGPECLAGVTDGEFRLE